MNKKEYGAFVQRLARTAEVFGEALSDGRAMAYFEALADLDLSDIKARLDSIERHGKFWPRPAEIREALSSSSPDVEHCRSFLRVVGIEVPSDATVERVNAAYTAIRKLLASRKDESFEIPNFEALASGSRLIGLPGRDAEPWVITPDHSSPRNALATNTARRAEKEQTRR